MLVYGFLGILAGEIWNHWFPINKNLWTSSYVLFTAGGALICLTACYWATDVKVHRGRWATPFLILGTNAITAYVLSEVLGGWLAWKGSSLFRWLAVIDSPAAASLLHSFVLLVLSFLPVWWMYRKRIFLKI